MDGKTYNFSGQVAIVTGGGRGLGRVMAQTLALAGSAVAVVARSQGEIDETAALITQDGGKALAICIDVTDRAAVEQMARQVEQELGAVNLLVNNAGIVSTPGPTWEADVDEWQQVMDINLHGPFLCARAILQSMIERKQGRIINISSSAGRFPVAYGNSYSTAKTALARFSECLAGETRIYGISVFTIDPGSVRTAMLNYLIESPEGQKWLPDIHQYAAEVGVFHSVEQPANLVMLLASGQADALSGRFFTVDDEMDALIQKAEQIQTDDLYTLRRSELPSE